MQGLRSMVESLRRRLGAVNSDRPLPFYTLCPLSDGRFICYKLELGRGPVAPYISDENGNFIAPLPEEWPNGEAKA